MIEIKPNTKLTRTIQAVPVQLEENRPYVFAAGSIEMGDAKQWQIRFSNQLKDYKGTIYNPRRDDWDSNWKQREHSDNFNEQVNWELDKLEDSDIIFLYFDPDTKSPISLLELGMFGTTHEMIVVCPTGFWRKGNVEIICSRYNIPLYNTFEEGVGALKTKLKRFYRS